MSDQISGARPIAEGAVRIEVADRTGQLSPEGASERIAEVTRAQLSSIAETIRASCQPLIAELKGADFRPNKIAIEFGVGVEAGAKVPFITSGTLSGNFKVSVEWELGG